MKKKRKLFDYIGEGNFIELFANGGVAKTIKKSSISESRRYL